MQRKPDWLKVKIPSGDAYNNLNLLIEKNDLHTICNEAKCPNRAECFSRGTATFLILGDICTRNCHYCNVRHGKPLKADPDEPKKVAKAISKMKLSYAVITSVTRDDLEDGGASVFAETVKEIRKINNKAKIELLIPDFRRNWTALKKIIESKPDVIGHNIEVIKSLFPALRPQGDYKLSLSLLEHIKKIAPKQKTKSGLMIGFGESKKDITNTIKDLRDAKVDFLTIGQYLQPSKAHFPVKKFYSPQEFEEFKIIGMKMGFSDIESGPLVRSSYNADKIARMI